MWAIHPRAIGRLIAFCALASTASAARATDRYFDDLAVASPNQRYKVEARSPDNQKPGRQAFQADFVYTCADTKTHRVVWTRKQAMSEPRNFGDDGEVRIVRSPEEGSPADVFVSDAGWTVILTSWNDLIVVGRDGRDRGKVDILKDAFSKEENEKHVHETTAGPIWTGMSRWYFFEHDKKCLFVVRPWWGNYVVVDLQCGKLVEKSVSLLLALDDGERERILADLRNGVAHKKALATDEDQQLVRETLTAAFLAGKLQVKEAVPLLRELEDSPHLKSCTMMLACEYKPVGGGLDPGSWCVFGMRQAAHLSLRRLGQTPGPYPCTQFRTKAENGRDASDFVPSSRPETRAENVGQIKVGTPLEEVLTLLGEPDLIRNQIWSYDIDAKKPYTLQVHWGEKGVTRIRKIKPPLWQTEQWDQEVAYP